MSFVIKTLVTGFYLDLKENKDKLLNISLKFILKNN